MDSLKRLRRMIVGEDPRYYQILDAIDEVRPRSILEVGTWNGDRAVHMIRRASRYRPKSEITYFGFDLFEDLTEELCQTEWAPRPPPMRWVGRRLKRTGVHTELVKGNTRATLPSAAVAIGMVDFVWLDGGHSLPTIASDWAYVSQIMHDRTVVMFDDYWRDREDAGCKPLIDSLDRSQYDVEILPIEDHFNNKEGPLWIRLARVKRLPVRESARVGA